MPLPDQPPAEIPPRRVTLPELGRLFLKLGFIGFGGPLVHIALIQDECVEKRGWIAKPQFLEGLALCQILPGPASTQLAIYSGYRIGGIPRRFDIRRRVYPAGLFYFIGPHLGLLPFRRRPGRSGHLLRHEPGGAGDDPGLRISACEDGRDRPLFDRHHGGQRTLGGAFIQYCPALRTRGRIGHRTALRPTTPRG